VSSLEQIAVGPSHYEVTVVTISCGISVCKSKFEIGIGARIKEELEENRQKSNWVRLWAHTAIIITDSRVRHMAFVIGRIKVFTIPARGEVNLSSQREATLFGNPGASAELTAVPSKVKHTMVTAFCAKSLLS